MINLPYDKEIFKATGVKVSQCPPANCAGHHTNPLTRKDLAKARRKFTKQNTG